MSLRKIDSYYAGDNYGKQGIAVSYVGRWLKRERQNGKRYVLHDSEKWAFDLCRPDENNK